MSRPKILVTHPLFAGVRDLLDSRFETEYWKAPQPMPRPELLERVTGKDGLVCLLSDKINDELLGRATKLRIAATVSVGYDNIDVPACTRHNVTATNTPGVLDDTTADLAWALLMAVARRVVEGDAMIRAGKWTGWEIDQFMGGDVWGKTLGIIGFGRIGQEVARRAAGFKMRILYNSRNRVTLEKEKEFHAAFVDRDTLLRESDFVSLHVPLTPETRHLIDRQAIAKMKPTAYLINTTRGPVVDEAALAEALAARQIAGAGLDVFEREPVVLPALLPMSNVVLTPHIGSGSIETRTNMGLRAAKNVVAFFDGLRPPDALNPELFEKR
ncbi:MAG TPA: D-glycerate dehydrogenase [Verrucomicrobiae bacterium]|nr:D-glycerate dehydrogenase [Verrucomicrobiae bacterium]